MTKLLHDCFHLLFLFCEVALLKAFLLKSLQQCFLYTFDIFSLNRKKGQVCAKIFQFFLSFEGKELKYKVTVVPVFWVCVVGFLVAGEGMQGWLL